jgi:hypothetical protein
MDEVIPEATIKSNSVASVRALPLQVRIFLIATE